jgi:tRNA pseudouridine38-40 synthase
VQSILESAIYGLSQEWVEATAAGRTDAGVHATGQVADFILTKDFSDISIRQGINFYMHDQPVSILAAQKVSDDFSARFSAKKRYYKYIILNRSSPTVLHRNRVWNVPQKLDIKKMKKAAKHFKGNHDFTSFRSVECQAKNPIRTLDKIKIEADGEFVYLYFSARSFLHHMVRNIVGTLVQVGLDKIDPNEIPNIIKVKDRTAAGMMAPASGLYFTKVNY